MGHNGIVFLGHDGIVKFKKQFKPNLLIIENSELVRLKLCINFLFLLNQI